MQLTVNVPGVPAQTTGLEPHHRQGRAVAKRQFPQDVNASSVKKTVHRPKTTMKAGQTNDAVDLGLQSMGLKLARDLRVRTTNTIQTGIGTDVRAPDLAGALYIG